MDNKKLQRSMEKPTKTYMRNQLFFQNANNSDVIKLPQSKRKTHHTNQIQNIHKSKPQQFKLNNSKQMYNNKRDILYSNQKNQQIRNEINSQKNMKPRQKYYKSFNLSLSNAQTDQNKSSYNPISIPYFPQNQNLQPVHQSKQPQQYIYQQIYKQKNQNKQFKNNQQNIAKQLQYLIHKFNQFSVQVLHKLNNLQQRVQSLQKNQYNHHHVQQQSNQVSFSSVQKQIKQLKHQSTPPSIQQSFERKFNEILSKNPKNEQQNSSQQQQQMVQSEKYTQFQIPKQSNLDIKIKQSLKNKNWNETYSLVIANNSRQDLIQLLKYYQMPTDKLVQDCLFVEVKKNLQNLIVLKWLNIFLKQCHPSVQKIKKLYHDLNKSHFKSYNLGNQEQQLLQYNQIKSYLINSTKKIIDQQFNYHQQSNNHQNHSYNYSFKNKIF